MVLPAHGETLHNEHRCYANNRSSSVKVVGLTGGIGVGKSTVATMFADRGAEIVDVDGLGREVIAAGGSAVDAVVARFGEQVRAEDGSIDRAALAPIVFGDPAALADLNAISHPAIDRLLDERLESIAAARPDAIVVLDMAVLTESTLGQNIAHPYGEVVVVEAPTDVRITRLIERGHTRADAEARMASQSGDEQRRAIADHIVTNDADLETLRARVDRVWAALTD